MVQLIADGRLGGKILPATDWPWQQTQYFVDKQRASRGRRVEVDFGVIHSSLSKSKSKIMSKKMHPLETARNRKWDEPGTLCVRDIAPKFDVNECQ